MNKGLKLSEISNANGNISSVGSLMNEGLKSEKRRSMMRPDVQAYSLAVRSGDGFRDEVQHSRP